MSDNNLINITQVMSQDFEMPLDIVLYGSIFYTLIFSIGVFGNILVLYVLLKDADLRNFTNFLLANFSIADLLVLFTNVPTGLHDLFAKERWYLGEIWCHLIYFIEHTTGFASILSMFFITCDRYYVICRPLKVKSVMNQTRTFEIIIFIWIISIFVNLPYIFLANYGLASFINNEINYKCTVNAKDDWTLYYIIIDSFVFYVVIGIILFFMYYKITESLRTSATFLKTTSFSIYRDSIKRNLINKAQENIECQKNLIKLNEISLNGYIKNGSTINQKEPNKIKYVRQRRQLVIMLIFVLVTFYVCVFPLKIWNLLNLFAPKINGFYQAIGFKLFWFLNVTCRIFYYLNSSINPILYNYLSKKFCYSFKKLLIFRICCFRGKNLRYKASYSLNNRSQNKSKKLYFDYSNDEL